VDRDLRSIRSRLSPLITGDTNRYISGGAYAWGYLHRALESRTARARSVEGQIDVGLRNVRSRYSFSDNTKNILLDIASKPFIVTAHSGSVELPFIPNGQAWLGRFLRFGGCDEAN
jgi:hypothetical protein